MKEQNNKKLDFSGEPIFVGLDVHKKSWKVTIMTASHEHKTFTQLPQANLLVGYLQRTFPKADYRCAYEAGFSGFGACRQLRACGVNCIIVNPADVPTGDKEKRRKSDRIDSRKIARSLRSQELEAIYLPSIQLQEERSLLRTRAALVKDMTRCKNRIRSFLYFHGIDLPVCYDRPGLWSKSFVSWLQGVSMQTEGGRQSLLLSIRHLEETRGTLLEVTRKVRELSRTNRYAGPIERLRSIPGIGPLASMILLTELGDIKRFKNLDTLCAYVGVIPDQHGSGEHEVIGEVTSRNNRMLRKVLVESARVAVRKDPALMQSYIVYCKRMHSNKAIVRIMRKLLSRVRYILLHEQCYQTGKII